MAGKAVRPGDFQVGVNIPPDRALNDELDQRNQHFPEYYAPEGFENISLVQRQNSPALLNFNAPREGTPVELERAGLFLVGDALKVMCFICNLTLRDHTSSHDPWLEHFHPINGISAHLRCLCPFVVRKLNENRAALMALGGANRVSSCVHLEYARLESREDSYFQNWPALMPHRPQDLSKNGFFYTGVYDRVKCYQCGLILGDWDHGQDIQERHIQGSPGGCLHLALRTEE